jgi:L-2-hydroxyglutarate oxidase LhgO
VDDKAFLGKRRDRALAIILSYKEQHVDPELDDSVAAAFRKLILDQINEVTDLAFDLIGSESVYNEEFMRKLDEIYVVLTDEDDSD